MAQTNLNCLLLGDKLGGIANQLALSGHDDMLIVVGINKSGAIRILGDTEDTLKIYGAFVLVEQKFWALLTEEEKKQ